jgi:hypothetical protein
MILLNEIEISPGLEPAIGVQVFCGDEILPEYKQFLEKANLSNYAPIEAWVVKGTNTQINYSTHGAYRYFGKFPAPIAAKLIFDYTKKGDLVIDPACGSGTTGVEALLSGRNALLHDVNPLSILISKVKTTQLNESDLANSISNLKKNFSRSKVKPFSTKEVDLDHWFLPETISQLSRLRSSIYREKNSDIQDFLLMVFSSIIRRVSRATTQQGRLFLDVDTAVEDIWPTFEKAADKASARIAALPKSSTIQVFEKGLLGNDQSGGPAAPLVIYHPPYFNAYKYTSINSLEMAWLNFERKITRKNEIREFFKIGKIENAHFYVEDMVQSLTQIRQYVEPDGTVAMMIGDALMKGQHVDVTSQIISKVSNIFKVQKTILRIPKFTEATWASSQRRNSTELGVTMYDFIIVFRAH